MHIETIESQKGSYDEATYNLRKAARLADRSSEGVRNNELDVKEIKLFINEAKALGCDMGDIISVATKAIPADTDNHEVQIVEKVKELDSKLKKLTELQRQYKDLSVTDSPRKEAIVNGVSVGSTIAGLGVGLVLANKIGFASLAAATLCPPLIGIAAAALVGGAAYYLTNKLTEDMNKNDMTEIRQMAENFKENEMKPLEKEIESVQAELRKLLNN